MTEISWPTSAIVRGFSLQLRSDQRVTSAQFGGSEHISDLQSDTWSSTVEFEFATRTQTGALDSFLTQLSTGTVYVKFGHLARPKNKGTLDSNTETLFTASSGADYLTLSAPEGKTLLTGDMLECGELLLQVESDSVADSSNLMEVFLVNRLRKDLPAFSTVNLTNPRAKFVPINPGSLSFSPNFSDRFKVDFEEFV
jgi:hypothetical protein